jgi:hypothetical protein
MIAMGGEIAAHAGAIAGELTDIELGRGGVEIVHGKNRGNEHG